MTHQLFSAIDKIFHSHPQRGAILVLFAITFPFLMAFSAIAVDLGTVYVQRVHLQNAADAAALAGAYQLGNSSDDPAVNSAVSYTAKNSPSDITVTSSDSTMPSEEKQINLSSDINRKSSYSTIEVQLRERVPLYFFRYFGMENMPIAVTAKAQYTGASTSHGLFTSAIIGGNTTDRSIYWATTPLTVIGDIQTNGKIYLNGPYESTLENGSIIGSTKSVNDIWSNPNGYAMKDVTSSNYSQGSINISLSSASSPNPVTNEIATYISNIADMTLEARQNSEIYYDPTLTSYQFNGSNAQNTDYPHISSGTAATTFNSSESWKVYYLNYHIIIVGGDLIVNIPKGYEPKDNDYTILISLNGSISLQNESSFRGLIYAPNGQILLDGKSTSIIGSIVGSNILASTPNTVIQHEDLNIPGITMTSNNTGNQTPSVRLIF